MEVVIAIISVIAGIVVTHLYSRHSSKQSKVRTDQIEKKLNLILQFTEEQVEKSPNESATHKFAQTIMSVLDQPHHPRDKVKCPECNSECGIGLKQDHDAIFETLNCSKCGYSEERLGTVL